MIIIIHLPRQVLIYLVRFPPAYTRWSRSLYNYSLRSNEINKNATFLTGGGGSFMVNAKRYL